MREKIVQTAGREQLGAFAPEFAHFNDDCVKIGLNRTDASILRCGETVHIDERKQDNQYRIICRYI